MSFSRKQRVVSVLRHYQRGRCAHCNEPKTTMVLDHDHETDLVRGLLCGRCNTAEGRAAPDDDAWIEYRTNPPARAAGVEVDYWDVCDNVRPPVEV